MYKTPGYSGAGAIVVKAKELGIMLVQITWFIVVIAKKNCIEEAGLALVVKDVATSFMYLSALKSEEECHLSLIHSVSHEDVIGELYSDNAQELIKAGKSLSWRHELSGSPSPYRPSFHFLSHWIPHS